MKKSPIVILDDDRDDLELMSEAASTLGLDHPIICFETGDELINYLSDSDHPPFLILCDVNLPRETGFQIRERIAGNPDLKYQSVPFVFWSTSGSKNQIKQAYDSLAQGFFIKPVSYSKLCDVLRTVVDYWSISEHPTDGNGG